MVEMYFAPRSAGTTVRIPLHTIQRFRKSRTTEISHERHHFVERPYTQLHISVKAGWYVEQSQTWYFVLVYSRGRKLMRLVGVHSQLAASIARPSCDVEE